MNIDTLIKVGGLILTLGMLINQQYQLTQEVGDLKSLITRQGKTIVEVQVALSSVQSQLAMYERVRGR
jgi:hypothetical protein